MAESESDVIIAEGTLAISGLGQAIDSGLVVIFVSGWVTAVGEIAISRSSCVISGSAIKTFLVRSASQAAGSKDLNYMCFFYLEYFQVLADFNVFGCFNQMCDNENIVTDAKYSLLFFT